VIAVRAKVFAVQLVAFSAVGWLVAGILDVVGVFRLSDALVVSGLLMGVITGLVAFQGGDSPLIRRASPIPNMPLMDGVGPGVTPSGARALAVASAGVAAVGLIAAGVILG
jgi:hypothetical protein